MKEPKCLTLLRDTKKSHNAQLRAACEAALKEIQEMVGADNSSEGDPDGMMMVKIRKTTYHDSR